MVTILHLLSCCAKYFHSSKNIYFIIFTLGIVPIIMLVCFSSEWSFQDNYSVPFFFRKMLHLVNENRKNYIFLEICFIAHFTYLHDLLPRKVDTIMNPCGLAPSLLGFFSVHNRLVIYLWYQKFFTITYLFKYLKKIHHFVKSIMSELI